jgi:diguanylate cyclase (GGDEF)-like protein
MLARVWLFFTPALAIGAAVLLAPRVELLPPTLAGLKSWGPLLLILLAAALAFGFNRGRALFAVAALAAAFAGYMLFLSGGQIDFTARTVYAAICIFVPLDLLVLSQLRERGIFTLYGIRRGGSILLQILLTAWVVSEHNAQITQFAYMPLFDRAALAGSPMPQLGQLLLIVGVSLCAVRSIVNRSMLDAGLAGALTALGVACDAVANPHVFQVFVGTAALIVIVTVLQDTYRLAFQDELTGLPSRRALNERLLALGHRFAVAMVDVDHFKRFNDQHGHDLGDQVLKIVAARLARVGGGGRAYRYGGEEFTLVFAGRSLADAVPRLEAVRREIEHYRVAVRAPDRPARDRRVRPRSAARPSATVSVTISIGVAERNERNPTPLAVLQAADKALYRAKGKGRNQTCW